MIHVLQLPQSLVLYEYRFSLWALASSWTSHCQGLRYTPSLPPSLTTITPSLLSHHHYCDTITTIITTMLAVTTITPSYWSHPHYYHTLTTITPSQSNASIALMSTSDTLLLSLLEPRESCTELQILTVRIIIKMIHVLHCSISEEVSVHHWSLV